MIYAIQIGARGPIKFGRAENVKKRLSALQTSTPKELRLLGSQTTDDDKYAEATIHAACKPHRIRGEWFKLSRETKRFACDIARGEWHRAWAYQIVRSYRSAVFKYRIARLLSALRAYHAKSVH